MASLIKNQILKHLSKFVKNLSPDQIHLSTLKGEGELKNLVLNEDLLTELLELPTWLRLRGATCDRVSVRIAWTKLKSVPMHLALEEVRVDVETCETLRAPTSADKRGKPSYASGGQYGFVDKVIDGITVSVASVVLTLHSRVFTASFQMSRILLESMSPTWSKADLRMTRLKSADRTETLNFKELTWQTLRIEAKATNNEDLTPLRLITNQARCRITIKKRIADCTVLGCRLVIILDDLLWVLTDDQLKAALHFADSLSGLLKRATQETQKVKGARKLKSLSEFHTKASAKDLKKKSQAAATAAANAAAARVFARYDVIETSYHFSSDRIDLHLCDDPGGKGRSSHPQLSDGGAFQVSLSQLKLDFYPYHLAAGNRSAWICYQESVHATWLSNSVMAFESDLLEAVANDKKSHSPLARQAAKTTQSQSSQQSNGDVRGTSGASTGSTISGISPGADSQQQRQGIRDQIQSQFKKLLTANLVVRINNFSMWKVSTSKEKKTAREFVCGTDKPPIRAKARKKSSSDERERFSLPDDMPVVHFEYTQFYYPGGLDFPLPPPKFFAYINPIQLCLDHLTVLWLNAFSLNLQQSVKMLALEKGEPPYLDVKIEAIMFRIIVEAPEEISRQRDRPQALHLQVSRILAANYRSRETGSKADLARVLDQFQSAELFFASGFPSYPGDIPTVCDKLIRHAIGGDCLAPPVDGAMLQSLNRTDVWKVMKKTLLWTEAKDVWFVYLDPVWADFHGTPSSGKRPVPLVDAFPLTLWLYKQPDDEDPQKQNATNSSTVPTAKLHLLATVDSLVSAQLNHFQLLFLLRTVELISEMTTFLSEDVRLILGEEEEAASSVAVGVQAPQVDLSLLMPSISQSRDAIGGDFDTTSVFAADTSSIYSAGDLLLVTAAAAAAGEVSGENSESTPGATAAAIGEDISSAASTPLKEDRTQSQSDLFAAETRSQPSPRTSPTPVQMVSPQASIPAKIPAINVPPAASLNATPHRQQQQMVSTPSASSKKNSLTSSLTNMMASLDSSFRGTYTTSNSGTNLAGGGESDSVSASVGEEDDTSSTSSSDNFLLIASSESGVLLSASEAAETALFAVHRRRSGDAAAGGGNSPAVEYALEVTEDNATATDASSLVSSTAHTPRMVVSSEKPASINEPLTVKRERTVSVVTFHLGRFGLAQQSVGSHACVKLQVASLSAEECTAITWEEFQSKFTMRSKGWSETTLAPPESWCARLRFSNKAPSLKNLMKVQGEDEDRTKMSLRERISRSAEAMLEMRAQNLPLQFYLSTVDGLADLFEDELIPTPLPMTIRLDNITLHLVEDRPSRNVTCPGKLPVDIAIPAIVIARDRSGLFCIQPAESVRDDSAPTPADRSPLCDRRQPSSSMTHHLELVRSNVASIETELQQRASLLAADNAALRQQLDSAAQELSSLRRRSQEAEAARRQVARAAADLAAADKENKSLKQTVKYLQQELIKAGKKV